jgi:hypothetical protein
VMLGELIDLVSGIAMGEPSDKAKDLLGRVYEYFLGGFAGSEGKRGGEFYTPRSIVRLMVEMLEPYKGRVYDPCCGSRGMFVQSEKFIESHGGKLGDIAIYGQESNNTTWRLCKMNLAVRGIDADIRWNNEGSFHKDELKDLRFDYILANPPFTPSLYLRGDELPVAAPVVRWPRVILVRDLKGVSIAHSGFGDFVAQIDAAASKKARCDSRFGPLIALVAVRLQFLMWAIRRTPPAADVTHRPLGELQGWHPELPAPP